jgi:hypothetical protein
MGYGKFPCGDVFNLRGDSERQYSCESKPIGARIGKKTWSLLLQQHPHTIGPIQRHVNQQSEPDQPDLRNQQHQKIEADRRKSMQRVKPDSTTVWIINGVGQEMIQVYDNRSDHDDPCAFPTV